MKYKRPPIHHKQNKRGKTTKGIWYSDTESIEEKSRCKIPIPIGITQAISIRTGIEHDCNVGETQKGEREIEIIL